MYATVSKKLTISSKTERGSVIHALSLHSKAIFSPLSRAKWLLELSDFHQSDEFTTHCQERDDDDFKSLSLVPRTRWTLTGHLQPDKLSEKQVQQKFFFGNFPNQIGSSLFVIVHHISKTTQTRLRRRPG